MKAHGNLKSMTTCSSTAVAPAANFSANEEDFLSASRTANIIPLSRRLFADHLTPVLAYRSLVPPGDTKTPSFLFESVETGAEGSRSGRFSYLGARPSIEVIAKGTQVTVVDHVSSTLDVLGEEQDPMSVAERLSAKWVAATPGSDLPKAFTGGWVGYTSYDTVRFVERKKLPFDKAPTDDRNLPDIHLGLYNDVVVFDHVSKLLHVVCWVHLNSYPSTEEAFADGSARLESLCQSLHQASSSVLSRGSVNLDIDEHGPPTAHSNFSPSGFKDAVSAAKEFILSGDIFQIVLSQRFERQTKADPFQIYRALRIVNPSPYLVYLQTGQPILVASSPEILCRIANGRRVVNRPLAGTRRRGSTPEEDAALEADLLADEKEVAEHVMLVDLGRNDVGKVSKAGSVRVEKLMEVERYSHVMHISSTVTGELLDGMSCWDALRAALPVGTVSGAPKVRAMELIDQFEPTRRGPYSGGIGYVSFGGDMDIALALRTMVFPENTPKEESGEWLVHLQAGAGIVADSSPEAEYQETVNKAAALARAIDLAESSFT